VSRRRAASLAAAVIFLVAAPVASADTSSRGGHPALAQALKGDARVLYDAAREHFRVGDYASAYAKFQRALELSGDPRLNWNIAACERKAKHNANVLRLIERYLHDGEGWLSEDEKKEAARAAAAVRAFVASAEVTSQPTEGVEIYIDDLRVGVTPLDKPVWVDAGVHRVRFAKTGQKPVERTEEIHAGAELRWSVDLDHPTADASPALATASTPPTPAASDARTGESTPPSPTPGRKLGPLVLGGAGLATAIAGGVLVGLTTHQFSVLHDDCGSSCDPARWQGQRTMQTVGDVLLGVGGAALVAGIVWWAFSPSGGFRAKTASAPFPRLAF
jgi:hypothetical protein